MNEREETRQDKNVDRAVDALRAAPVPPGPPAEAIQAVLAAGRSGHGPTEIKKRRFTMNRISRIAAAILLVAAIAGAVAWLTVGNGASIALADVLTVLEQARTVCFRMTWRNPGTEPWTDYVMFLEPSRTRSESPEMVSIIDWSTGQILGLYPRDRMAFSGTIKEMGNPYQSNWFDNLKNIIGSDQATEAGEKVISGRTVKGWRIEDEDWIVTVWADTDNAELVQVDFVKDRFSMTMSDFELGRELDEALFSLEPPEGYWMAPKFTMKASDPAAEDVAKLLEIWARGNGASFPDNLNSWEFSAAAQKVKWRKDEVIGTLNEQIGKAFAFLYGRPGWAYAGKGVKLGDAETAIFWYKPKDSETYKVIYGDLRVEDVAEEDLPKAEPAAEASETAEAPAAG